MNKASAISFPVLLVVSALAQMAAGKVNAGNLYDPASGELMLPSIQVGGQYYSGTFSRLAGESLTWIAASIQPDAESSRSEAVFNGASRSLWVPEINIQGKLYNMSFGVSNDCGHDICLNADLSTLEVKGRYGSEVFTNPVSDASTYSCSSCHAISEEDGFASDGLRRPGHPLLNAVNRPDFKNGQLDSLLAAVNICLTEWMNTDHWTGEESDWVNLNNWFSDMATDEIADPVVIDITTPPQDVSGGEPGIGRELFNTRCRVCHGLDGEGTLLAPKITNTGLNTGYIAGRIRRSGLADSAAYVGLAGGIMPFWGADRLSDQEMIDIVAFVANGSPDTLGMGEDDPMQGSDSGCGKDSVKIGQTATLSTLFHNVSGTATIIDDCTVEIRDFSYDGGGIDVRIYAGVDGQFHAAQGGFSLSADLVGIAYHGNTLRLTLPEGKTLDDFNSIAVWCVAVGVSFGTGYFE